LILLNQKPYKLLLLDTNVLRQIISNKDSEMKLVNKFLCCNNYYAFCFSVYNVIEIKPMNDIYKNFLDIFSLLPCFLTFPFKTLIKKEWLYYKSKTPFQVDNLVANAFSPLGTTDNFHIKTFMDSFWNEETKKDIETELNTLDNVVKNWEAQRKQLVEIVERTKLHRSMITDDYYKFSEKEAVINLLKSCGLPADETVDYKRFPIARFMNYSQFHRLYMTQKPICKNDVMDIKICAIAPYLDAVMVEKFQADVCKKAKNIIPEMKSIEIYTVKDIV
jgi:hypothetical protein